MDLLLDINDTSKVPQNLRIDLGASSPTSSAAPFDPDPSLDTEALHRELQEAHDDYSAGRISPDEVTQRETAIAAKFASLDRKTYAELLKVPHTHFPP